MFVLLLEYFVIKYLPKLNNASLIYYYRNKKNDFLKIIITRM